MTLCRRNKAPYDKRQNVPVVVLSNKSYREWYKDLNDDEIEALKTRFHHVVIPHEGPGCLMRRLINDGTRIEDDLE